MTLAAFAKSKGYTLAEFQALQARIAGTADDIAGRLAAFDTTDSGMYYPVQDILDTSADHAPYLIQALKQRGVEFRENNSLWRY